VRVQGIRLHFLAERIHADSSVERVTVPPGASTRNSSRQLSLGNFHRVSIDLGLAVAQVEAKGAQRGQFRISIPRIGGVPPVASPAIPRSQTASSVVVAPTSSPATRSVSSPLAVMTNGLRCSLRSSESWESM